MKYMKPKRSISEGYWINLEIKHKRKKSLKGYNTVVCK